MSGEAALEAVALDASSATSLGDPWACLGAAAACIAEGAEPPCAIELAAGLGGAADGDRLRHQDFLKLLRN